MNLKLITALFFDKVQFEVNHSTVNLLCSLFLFSDSYDILLGVETRCRALKKILRPHGAMAKLDEDNVDEWRHACGWKMLDRPPC
jgi:hypothetical protein